MNECTKILLTTIYLFYFWRGSSWSWSYGSWISASTLMSNDFKSLMDVALHERMYENLINNYLLVLLLKGVIVVVIVCSWIYNYLCNQCLSPLILWVRTPLRRGVLDTTLCDKGCQWLAICRWFSLGTPVSSTNKTDHHDIAEILLKVALNTKT